MYKYSILAMTCKELDLRRTIVKRFVQKEKKKKLQRNLTQLSCSSNAKTSLIERLILSTKDLFTILKKKKVIHFQIYNLGSWHTRWLCMLVSNQKWSHHSHSQKSGPRMALIERKWGLNSWKMLKFLFFPPLIEKD